MKYEDLKEQSKYYSTEYKTNGKTFCSYVKASSPSQANLLADARNMGEVVTCRGLNKNPEKSTSQLFKEGKYQSALHGLVFLLHKGANQGKVDLVEATSDDGVLHNMIHFMTLPKNEHLENFTEEAILLNIEELEKIII